MVQTDGQRAVGWCTVTWLPNFLGWVDLLSYGAPPTRGAPLKHLQWYLSMAAPGFTWPNKIPLPSLLRRLSILDLSCRSYQFIAWWCDLIYTFCPFKILTKPSSQQLKISRPCMVVITIYLVLLHSVLPHSLTMLRLWRECFKEGTACSEVNPASTIVGYSIRKTLVKTV